MHGMNETVNLFPICPFLQINKGDYECEVVIFGPPDAQRKAKAMIEDLVTDDSSPFHLGIMTLPNCLLILCWQPSVGDLMTFSLLLTLIATTFLYSITHFFLGLYRTVDQRGDKDRGRENTVWSAEQLQAAAAQVQPRIPIDWATIRENKTKYEELKWKGESIMCPVDQLCFTEAKTISKRVASQSHAVDLCNFLQVKRLFECSYP